MTRELVYTGFMSLDGVVDSPGGKVEGHRGGGWVMDTEFVPEAFALKGEELADTTALMFGRRSYEAFAPAWRDSDDHAAYKDLPKYVVSSGLREDALIDGWGPITVLRTADDVAKLKQTDGGPIYIHGSAELAGVSRTPTSSTGTTCSCSRYCWARANTCSAAPTATGGTSGCGIRPPTPTA